MTPFEWVFFGIWSASLLLSVWGFALATSKGRRTLKSDPDGALITTLMGIIWGILLLTIAQPLTWFGIVLTVLMFVAAFWSLVEYINGGVRRNIYWTFFWRMLVGITLITLLFTVGITA